MPPEGYHFLLPLNYDGSTNAEAAPTVALHLSRDDATVITHLADTLGLSQLGTQAVSDAILAAAAEDSDLSPKAFFAAIRAMVPHGTELDLDSQLLLTSAVSALADYLALANNSYDEDDAAPSLDVRQVITAMGLLAGGSKSEKLSALFTLFDEDADGRLVKGQLSKLLLAVMLGVAFAAMGTTSTTAATTTGTPADEDEGKSSHAELARAVAAGTATAPSVAHLEAAASALADRVFAEKKSPPVEAGHENEGDSITFDELSQWYNEGGHAHAPFLELLDLKVGVTLDLL